MGEGTPKLEEVGNNLSNKTLDMHPPQVLLNNVVVRDNVTGEAVPAAPSNLKQPASIHPQQSVQNILQSKSSDSIPNSGIECELRYLRTPPPGDSPALVRFKPLEVHTNDRTVAHVRLPRHERRPRCDHRPGQIDLPLCFDRPASKWGCIG